MNNIVAKKAEKRKEIDDALGVRYKVFVVEQKIDKDLEHDSFDENCDHFVAYLNDLAVGAARVRYLEPNVGKIERMAVLSEYRGKNIGRTILETILKYLKDEKVLEVVLNSQYHAKGFYEKYGFEVEGKIFQEANIDHVKMKKRLK